MMVGVSGAMLYTSHVIRSLEAQALEAEKRGELRQNFPSQLLTELRSRLDSRKGTMWAFVVVGSLWGLQNILI